MPPQHGRHYGLCAECGRAITPKQTWKFQPATGKRIHYYCDPRRNPGSETLESLIRQEGRRIAHRFHPEEWGQPVSREFFDFHLYKHPEDVIPGWGGMLPQEKQRAERQLFNAYQREAQKILAGRVENPAGPTFHQAVVMARAAGAKIGDTDGFGPWLAKVGLDTRGPQVRRELETAFWVGVEHGPLPTHRTKPAVGRPQIWQTEEGWKTAVDPESTFDARELAEQFVASQRNPRRQNPNEPWWKRRTA